MKKFNILSLFLIASLILNFAAPTLAAENESISIPHYETALLKGFDIEINPDATSVTRGEFATNLSKIAGSLAPYAESKQMIFSDVSLTQAESPYITAVYNAGIMNGIGEGKFGTNSTISATDAVVALVRLAGYEKAALSYGGYPSGYLRIASDVGILDSVSANNQPLTPAVMSALLYNTLHTDVYKMVSVGDTVKYEARKGEDVLMVYHSIYRTDVLVTANRFTSLSSSVTPCASDEIELDKELYKYSGEDAENYLGMAVTAYWQASSSRTKTVIAMIPDESQNKVITLTEEDIESLSGYTLTYYDGEKEKTAAVARGFNFIYNGKYYADGKIGDILIPDSELTLIDSDSVGGYETVILCHGTTLIVTNIDRTAYTIYGQNKANAIYDSSAHSSYFEIKDTSGNELYIDRIKNGNVLTVFASKDNQYIKIILSTDVISGTITAFDSATGEVILKSGKEEMSYKIASGCEDGIGLGLSGEFYLDAFGKLVYSDSELGSDFEYGYLVNISLSDGMDNAKCLILNFVDFETFVISSKLNLDGKPAIISSTEDNAIISGGKAIPQVVRYKTDSKGEIRYLDTIAVGSGDAKSDSLRLSKTISGTFRNEYFSSISNQCTISSNTLCIKVPETASYMYDTAYYASGSDVFADDKSYSNVDVYDIDEALNPKVAVYKSDTGVSTSINDYSTCGIIKETGVTLLDKDGEKREAIRIFNVTGEEKTVYIEPEYNLDKDNLAELEFGDVIRYSADADGCLANWKYDYDYSAGTVAVTDAYFQRYAGYPYAKKDGSFSFLSLAGNPDLSAGIDELMDHLLVFPTSVMTFIEVDFKTGEIALSGYEYVDSFMHSGNTANKSYLKIYRGGGYYKDMLVTYKNVPASD